MSRPTSAAALIFASIEGMTPMVLDHAGMTSRSRGLLSRGVWARCTCCGYVGDPSRWTMLASGYVCTGCPVPEESPPSGVRRRTVQA